MKSAPASARKRKPSRSTTFAGTDFHIVAVVLAHPFDGHLLPVRIALGRVDAQNVGASLDQSGNTLGVVAGVDARANQVALLVVEQLERVFLMGVVVLTEHEVAQVIVRVDDRQAVELVIPDDVVGFLERGAFGSNHEILAGSHELGNLGVERHARKAIVALGNDAEQLAASLAVIGDGHGGMAGLLLQGDDFLERGVGRKVGVGNDEAGLVRLHASDHGRFALDGLVAVNKRNATFSGEGNSHVVVRNSGHNCRHHGDVQRNGALFLTLAVTHQRRFQVNLRRDAGRRGVARDQQILIERTRGFLVVERHLMSPSVCVFSGTLTEYYMHPQRANAIAPNKFKGRTKLKGGMQQ